MDERYCDLRQCFALAEVEVTLPLVDESPTGQLLLCAPHFRSLMLAVESAKVSAVGLERV